MRKRDRLAYIEYEISKSLEAIPDILQRQIAFWSRLLSRVGSEGEEIMKEEAPEETGYLKSTIYHIVSLQDREVRIRCDAEYAAAVERGTRSHDIVLSRPLSLRDKAEREGKKNLFFRAGTVLHHPGTRPNPFGRRTYIRLKSKVDAITAEEISDWLEE